MHVLYLSYDGLTSLLGQSQVWPYVKGLAAAGHRFDVLSFEQRDRLARIGDSVRREVAESGIAWHPRRFRTRPPVLAKMLDLAEMNWRAQRIAAARRPQAVHARSYVAADAALGVKRRLGVPFIFDMRGFWVDEMREGGRWPAANPLYRRLYRKWKLKERAFISGADHIIVLTEAARAVIEGWDAWRGQPISVIPCCIDHQVFAPGGDGARMAARARLGIDAEETVLAYLGSIDRTYALGDMLRFYARMRRARRRARFLFVSWHAQAEIMAAARAVGLEIPAEEIIVQPAEHGEVPFWLAAADLAIAFRKPSFSGLGASPTKLGEYLACGLPVLVNDGVGDVGAIVEGIGAGTVLGEMTDAAFDAALAGLDELIAIDPAALRERSRAMHDMPVALRRYRQVYDSVATLVPEQAASYRGALT